MKIHVHLGPAAKPSSSEPALQILLTRCQATPRSGWVSTSFHKAVKQFDGRKVDGHFKSLKKGALPGLVAWLLRKQAGAAEPLSRQVSDQLGELIVQSDAKRKQTWLWAFLGGDPRHFFRQVAGVWQPGEALQKAEVVAFVDGWGVFHAGSLDSAHEQELDVCDMIEAAISIVPAALLFEVQFKPNNPGSKAWARIDSDCDLLTAIHEMRIRVECLDEVPRNIALAYLSAGGKAVGLWPWTPVVEREWDAESEIKRIIATNLNPKLSVVLPEMWNRDGKSPILNVVPSGDADVVALVTYPLHSRDNPADHLRTLQKIAHCFRLLSKCWDELLSPPRPSTDQVGDAVNMCKFTYDRTDRSTLKREMSIRMKKHFNNLNLGIECVDPIVIRTQCS
jgi:hypothetical protein